ncbi:flagellar hook-length control protein FliK [Onishia niordana]|uniref:flagellar hook-length control protein FliK n=1 Tax=Onishia niordana TaxID=2508711 RepID=UPI00109F300C|nr:flagellar hook-length control protein FliK [Halomonas niordiana]
MGIIDFIPTSAPSSGKLVGRQANDAKQGGSQDFGTLLAKRQNQGNVASSSASPDTKASQQSSPAGLKEALSTLSPKQREALSDQLGQDPAALERLTSSQQEALASLLEGESLGGEAAQDLNAALSALGLVPFEANDSLNNTSEGPKDWFNATGAITAGDATPAPEGGDAPLALSMIAERMNLIDQAGHSAGTASPGDSMSMAGNGVTTGDARREQTALNQATMNADWLNRSAVAQAVNESMTASRQGQPAPVMADNAAAALLTDASETRGVALTSPSTGTDTLALSTAQPGSSALAGAAQSQAGGGALTAPVATQQWQQQLGQQLIGMAQRGDQQMELKLHPTDLGPLSVTLKVAENGAQAQFLSAHSQVRSALEQAIPQLREALAHQGITLGDTSVGHQASGQSQEQGFAGRQPSANGLGEIDDSGLDASAMLSTQGSLDASLLDGRVDLYA